MQLVVLTTVGSSCLPAWLYCSAQTVPVPSAKDTKPDYRRLSPPSPFAIVSFLSPVFILLRRCRDRSLKNPHSERNSRRKKTPAEATKKEFDVSFIWAPDSEGISGWHLPMAERSERGGCSISNWYEIQISRCVRQDIPAQRRDLYTI